MLRRVKEMHEPNECKFGNPFIKHWQNHGLETYCDLTLSVLNTVSRNAFAFNTVESIVVHLLSHVIYLFGLIVRRASFSAMGLSAAKEHETSWLKKMINPYPTVCVCV